MKAMKRTFAMLIALIMVWTMYVPVFAANDDNTLTINSKTAGHTYQAYQVFDGDYYEGILSNVKWGTGVNGDELLAALEADDTLKSYFAYAENAADIAEVLSAEDSEFTDNSELIDAFADVVAEHLAGTPVQSGDAVESGGNYVYTIGNLADGYYFVKEAAMADDENNSYTKFMLQVVGDTTVNAKADVPPIDKKIDGANDTDPGTTDDTEENNASIGDTIPFKVTSKVPNMDGYEKYYFVVTDTFSNGLTFNGDIAISIDKNRDNTMGEDEKLTADTDYTVETAGQTVTIIFKNFIQYKNITGADILITYSATLNDNAVIGTGGNENSVDLTYSNNPNVSDDGTPGNPDKPDSDSPVGETPDETTYTYATGVELTKVDPDRNRLEGAEFQISGTRVNKVVVYRDVYTESANGEYWKLKDGTYTTEAPDTGNADDYDSVDTKYALEEEREVVESEDEVAAVGYVGSDGILRFDGLAAGKYEITELTAPDGYNLLDGPITINIGWTAPAAPGGDCTWTVTGGNAQVNDSGIITITVENEKGSTLPETGGVGTVIFYVVGAGLMLGAAVLLVVKKRTSEKDSRGAR